MSVQTDLTAAAECFLASLMGERNFRHWMNLKEELQLENTECLFEWMLDVAEEAKMPRELIKSGSESEIANNGCGGTQNALSAVKLEEEIVDDDVLFEEETGISAERANEFPAESLAQEAFQTFDCLRQNLSCGETNKKQVDLSVENRETFLRKSANLFLQNSHQSGLVNGEKDRTEDLSNANGARSLFSAMPCSAADPIRRHGDVPYSVTDPSRRHGDVPCIAVDPSRRHGDVPSSVAVSFRGYAGCNPARPAIFPGSDVYGMINSIKTPVQHPASAHTIRPAKVPGQPAIRLSGAQVDFSETTFQSQRRLLLPANSGRRAISSRELKNVARTTSTLCSTCGKNFSGRGALREHNRIHSQDKPYKCPVCGMAFMWRSAKIGHITKEHAGHRLLQVSGNV